MTAAALADQREQAGIPLHHQGPTADTNTHPGPHRRHERRNLPPAASIPTPAPPVVTLGPLPVSSSAPATSSPSAAAAPAATPTTQHMAGARDHVCDIYSQLLDDDCVLGV